MSIFESIFDWKERGGFIQPDWMTSSGDEAKCLDISDVYLIIPAAVFWHKLPKLTSKDFIQVTVSAFLNGCKKSQTFDMMYLGKWTMPEIHKYRERENKSRYDPMFRANTDSELCTADDCVSYYGSSAKHLPLTKIGKYDCLIWKTKWVHPFPVYDSLDLQFTVNKKYQIPGYYYLYPEDDQYPLEWDNSVSSLCINEYTVESIHIACPIVKKV